jgi:hypothetical protein
MSYIRHLLVVHGDVEPEVLGPYPREAERTKAARRIRKAVGNDSGIYMLDVERSPKVPERPCICACAYSGGFFRDTHEVAPD